MRRVFLVGGTVLLSLILAAAGTPRAEETGPDIGRGAKLYSDNCGRCHNVRGPRQFSDREWPVIVTHMRVISGLPGDHARAIEAFLRASNNPPREEAAIAGPKRLLAGKDLIARNGCRGCHVIGGQGGAVGPSLEGVTARRDDEWLHAQIKNPRARHPQTVMPDYMLTDAEVEAIIDALR